MKSKDWLELILTQLTIVTIGLAVIYGIDGYLSFTHMMFLDLYGDTAT